VLTGRGDLIQLGAKADSGAGVNREGVRVTLTRSPAVVSKSGLSAGILCPPLALTYLAASVRQRGYPVSIVDPVGEAHEEVHDIPGRNAVTYGWSLEKVVQEIPADSRYIGISCMFSHEWSFSKEMIKAIRKRFADAVIIVGGEHVTAAPEETLRDCPVINYAVMGEGEETLVDLLDTLQQGGDPANVPGLFFVRDGKPVRTTHRERLKAVDDIPRPAWDLSPIENYLAAGLNFGVGTGRTMPILATRGCPYQCTFCSNPTMWTTRWYARSPKDVADEIEFYATQYGANNFDFYDLTAILKKSWIKEFCQELIDRKLAITWQLPAGTRSEAIDRDVAELLAASGHRNLVYAPETGSEAMLKAIKKKVNLDRMAESMKGAIEHDISIKLNMIIGFPQETRKDIRRTLWFLAKMAWLGVDDVTIATFVPYPGSQIFDELRASGRIQALDDDFYYALIAYGDAKNSLSFAEHLSSRELLIYRLGGMALFYGLSYLLRPGRLFQTVWHLWRKDHHTRIEKALNELLGRRRTKKAQYESAG
jgi:radical SAM superfamily enzyme YgiQ (UPF0313 family)